jgi:hypothetical protein
MDVETEREINISLGAVIVILFGCLLYALTLSFPSPVDDVTILGKTPSDGVSSKDFFVMTDHGDYPVVALGGNETTSRALWSYLEVGHTYDVVVSMGMIVGVEEE